MKIKVLTVPNKHRYQNISGCSKGEIHDGRMTKVRATCDMVSSDITVRITKCNMLLEAGGGVEVPQTGTQQL